MGQTDQTILLKPRRQTRQSLEEARSLARLSQAYLQMRARAFALRDAFADVLGGLYLREEMEAAQSQTPPLMRPYPIEAHKKTAPYGNRSSQKISEHASSENLNKDMGNRQARIKSDELCAGNQKNIHIDQSLHKNQAHQKISEINSASFEEADSQLCQETHPSQPKSCEKPLQGNHQHPGLHAKYRGVDAEGLYRAQNLSNAEHASEKELDHEYLKQVPQKSHKHLSLIHI